MHAVAVFRIAHEHEHERARAQALPQRKSAALTSDNRTQSLYSTSSATHSIGQRNYSGSATPASPVAASVQRNRERNAAADSHDQWESF